VVAPDSLVNCGTPGSTDWLRDPLLSTVFTRWGTDPIWDLDGVKRNNQSGSFTPAPVAGDFYQEIPAELSQFDKPTFIKSMSLATTGEEASILAYDPVFTSEDGWHCDIIFKRVPSYGCFLKLSLIRYQPNSISGKEISHVTSTPFVQLRPNRTVVIKPQSEKHNHLLAIYGTAPGSSAEGPSHFYVIVEVHHDGVWIKDDGTVICKPGARCTPNPTFDDGTGHPQPLLDAYVLVIQKNHYRRRRVLVSEYEKRRTYDLATLNDTTAVDYLVDTTEPIALVDH